MKKIIKEILVIGALSMAILGGFITYINKPQTTEDKLMDKVAYKQMLLKNAEGGVVSHSDELVYVSEQIANLRIELAKENQNKRHNN